MKKKILSSVIVLCLSMSVLFGCGSANESEPESVENEEVATESEAVAEETAEAPEEVAEAPAEETKEDAVEATEAAEPEAEAEPEPEKRENTDFRNACWGDSIEDVKKYETDAELLDDNGESLIYSTSLSGHDVYIIEYFDEGGLYLAVYKLNENLTTGGQYIGVLELYKEMLTKKYGEPDADTSGIIKYVSDSQIELAGEGQALEYGYTAYFYEWTTETTRISLAATSENYDITLMLAYSDLNYDSTEEELENF